MQYSRLFQRTMLCDEPTSTQLNRFLTQHPNYRVEKMSFDNPKGTCIENLFVVFNIEERK